MSDQSSIYADLVQQAKKVMREDRVSHSYETGIDDAETMLKDLDNFPHHFVLACLMDRQFDAKLVWKIPYVFGEDIGGFSFSDFENIGADEVLRTNRHLSRGSADQEGTAEADGGRHRRLSV